jgi:TusA-related sulfurtransferase
VSDAPPAADAVLDLSGVSCPITFARVSVALEGLASGGLLEVALDPGEPAMQVPRSVQLNGDAVEHQVTAGDGALRIWIRKR